MRSKRRANSASGVVFRRRVLSVPVSCCFMVMTLIGVVQATVPNDSVGGHLFSALLVVMTSVFTIRAYRMGTILAGADEVTVRGFMRTKRLSPSDIVRFFGQPRRSGAGQPGHTLAVELSQGRVLRFGEFFSRNGTSGPASVEGIAAQLNELYSHAAR